VKVYLLCGGVWDRKRCGGKVRGVGVIGPILCIVGLILCIHTHTHAHAHTRVCKPLI
jgi:hypothetical protein